MRRSCRGGFSLLEVLLATGILAGCLIVLSELAAIGRQHADDAQKLTTAQAICQTKLSEILAGLAPADPIEDQEVEDQPGWLYSIDAEPLQQPGLLALRVTVTENIEGRPPREVGVVRWIPDPDYRRDAEEWSPRMRLPPGFRGGRRR